jgi:hypothetical protein
LSQSRTVSSHTSRPDDDTLSRAILNSIQSRIAVVDESGVIVHVNDAWIRFAIENGDPMNAYTGVGINYLDVMQRSIALGDESARKPLAGIESVLRGESALYELRYPCHSATEERWFLMRVTPLKSDTPRGVVVSHIDITTQHLAARSRARRARRQQDARRQEREFVAIQSVADAIPRRRERDGQHLLVQYETLLEAAVEARAFGEARTRVDGARAIAAALGGQTASPRDVIALHTDALKRARKRLQSPLKLQVYVEEGRLLLVEVMGYLAAYYRDMIIDELEQQAL